MKLYYTIYELFGPECDPTPNNISLAKEYLTQAPYILDWTFHPADPDGLFSVEYDEDYPGNLAQYWEDWIIINSERFD